MPYGHVSDVMFHALSFVVQDKEVWDIGAGDLERAKQLLLAGASHVHAVEKGYKVGIKPAVVDHTTELWLPERLTLYQAYVHEVEVPNKISVVCLFWPVNSRSLDDVLPFLAVSETIIYLGSNRFGTACGSPRLWTFLQSRHVSIEIQDDQNDMLVYVNQPRSEEARMPRDEYFFFENQLID